MRIKANKIQPGMLIEMKPDEKFKDTSLIIATMGRGTIEYTHFMLVDPYTGPFIGTIDGEVDVKIIDGDQRKQAIKKIYEERCRLVYDAKRDRDLIKLIMAMDEQTEAAMPKEE